jgi:DeoR family transcriptional regulator, glycerol-3-phosphate regulon repressor
MTKLQRQDKILGKIQKLGFCTIDDLVDYCGVTPQTIRRDLNGLARKGEILRHHGGAGIVTNTENTSYKARKLSNLISKQNMAEELVSMIPDGASLFINIGTTNEIIAKALLQHKNLKIVTNSLQVALTLGGKSDFSVVIAGGEVRYRDGGVIGVATQDFIKEFNMDFGIIGISGIDSDGSLLDFDYREVKVAQAIISNSRHVMLCADKSKFGRHAMVRLGNISQVDHFFTDTTPPSTIKAILKEHQVKVHVV